MAASFSLIIEDDAGKQIVVPFAKDVITIGRKEGNTIRLTERNVSRFHAKLMKEDGGVRVEDLSSFNGIKLNGDRISGTAQVNSGDVIEIGDYHLELRAAQAANVGPVGSKSVGVGAPSAGRDDFEGDTQRWDAPAPLRTPTRPPELAPSHGGFGGEGGDTERLDMGRLQALASGGQMAQPPPGLAPPQSWPAPSRPPMSSMLDLEPTARQPIAGVPIGGVAPPPPSFNNALQDQTHDLQLRATAPRDLIADSGDGMPAPAPTSAPPIAAMPAPSAAAVAPASRPSPRRNFEETEQLRAAPGAPLVDEGLNFPRLIALNTIFAGLEFPLKAMENVLGRTDDNDIVIEHRSISRNHAKFVRQGERVQVLDLKSANGVLVNGDEVDQHTLRSGDVVELGRVKLRFVPVGERFTLPNDEVERARLADNGGDEFEEGGKTTMVMNAPAMPTTSRPVALYALLAALGIVVVVLAVLLLTRGGHQDPPAPSTTTSSLPTPASPAEAAPPAPSPPETAPTPPAGPAPAAVATKEAAPATAQPDGAADPTLTAPRAAPDAAAAAATDGGTRPTKSTTTTPRKASPLDPHATAERVRELYNTGNFAEAVALLKELEKQFPGDPQYKSQIALYYGKMRDSKNAIAYFNRFNQVSTDPAKVESLKRLLAGNGIKVEP